MLKCVGAYTHELDNPKLALNEIKAQLDSQITLLPNTVGIVMCHPEFVTSGVAKYICESLPFDVAGATSASQAVNGEYGECIFTLFVMTADDVFFHAGITKSTARNIDEPVKEAWKDVSAGSGAAVKLALIFPPFLIGSSGDDYVHAWEKIIPGVPIFGSHAIDDSVNFSNCETIFNGEFHKTGMSFIMCYGAIAPRFLVSRHHAARTRARQGIVTKSSGFYVYEIDGINAREYLARHEYTRHLESVEHFRLLTFTVRLEEDQGGDREPVTKSIMDFTDDGALVFLSDVPEGASITPHMSSYADLVESAEGVIRELNVLPDVNGVLLFSCAVRRMILMRVDLMGEFKAVSAGIHPSIPYMMAYSGGEICPTSVRDHVPFNRHHNYSLIMLTV